MTGHPFSAAWKEPELGTQRGKQGPENLRDSCVAEGIRPSLSALELEGRLPEFTESWDKPHCSVHTRLSLGCWCTGVQRRILRRSCVHLGI